MTGKAEVEYVLQQLKPNQIFFAGRLYREKLSERLTEAAYYKILERMCKAGQLSKVAKGIYCKVKQGKYGVMPPSETEIVRAFTENHTGMRVGYFLYNSLQLTTQVGKNIEILTSGIEQQQKTIGNIHLTQCEVEYETETESVIQMLEVLQNYSEIQDLRTERFLAYAQAFSEHYNQEAFERVYRVRKYPKKVISFLAEILNYYGVAHGLNWYLSSLSQYKHPKMEALYESARA